MSKWIARFLKDESPSIYRTDKTDKPHGGGHLSVMAWTGDLPKPEPSEYVAE